MTKKPIKSIADKLSKVNETFTVHMYDNGYMLEIGGRGFPDKHGDTEWCGAKIIVPTVEDLFVLIKEVAELPRDTD